MVQKTLDHLCRLFGFLMVACLGLMVLMVFGNVVLRYGFNSGITVSEELSRWLFVWMTFLGAIVALRNHAHLGTDALVSRLPLAGRKACFALAHLAMLAICWLMFSGAWQQTVINWGTTSAVMQVPTAFLYVAGVLFAVLAAVILLLELWKLATGTLEEGQLIGVTESEDVPHTGAQPTTASAAASPERPRT